MTALVAMPPLCDQAPGRDRGRGKHRFQVPERGQRPALGVEAATICDAGLRAVDMTASSPGHCWPRNDYPPKVKEVSVSDAALPHSSRLARVEGDFAHDSCDDGSSE